MGRSYSAWAVSNVEGGRYTISNFESGVSAGQSVRLAEIQTQCIVAVEVLGLDAWRDDGPFSFEVSCTLGDHYFVMCDRNDAGHALIPPIPDAALFRVRSASGVVLAAGMVDLNEDRRRNAAERSDGHPSAGASHGAFLTISEDRTHVKVPPPVALHLEVLGSRKALKGAQVFWAERADRRLAATADKKGRAVVRVPSTWSGSGEPHLEHVSLWIEAPGWSSANWFADDLAVRDEDGDPKVHVVSLPKGNSIEGRLLLARGKPAADAPILVHTGFPSGRMLTDTQSSTDGAARVVWTDSKGNFEVHGMAPDIGWQISTLLGAGADVPTMSEFPLSPALVLASGEDSSKKKLKLGSITLSAFRAVDVTAGSPSGQGGVIADLAFRDELAASMQERSVCRVRTGPSGRACVLVRPGSRIIMTATGSSAHEQGRAQIIDVRKGKKPLAAALPVGRD